MTDRQYDVVLYGASGFVGRQAARYFSKHARSGEVRWAIAGRNRQKLETVKSEVGIAGGDVDILEADSRDRNAVDAIVAQTQVMLNTAGPFALYGDAIVDACVRFQTHYVDITGETPWVKDLIDRYHDRVAANGTRIIPFCGFDSVPSDLGTYLVVRHMQKELGVPCKEVKAYFQAYGGFNGGTLASAFNLYDSGQAIQVGNPFLLNPPGEHTREEILRSADPRQPQYNADIGTWVGPFFMGSVNTRVVRRSCALYGLWQEPYGSDFAYQEYMKFDRPWAWLKAASVTVGTALFDGAMRQTSIRHLLQPHLPQPGSGPSERTMDEGWFRCELIGIAEDGRRVRGLICDRGDPGNRSTVKFLCESALSLVSNANALPGGEQRGGILTPATALGNVLAERLRLMGTIIEIGEV